MCRHENNGNVTSHPHTHSQSQSHSQTPSQSQPGQNSHQNQNSLHPNHIQKEEDQSPQLKRRPGRPRGSKNKTSKVKQGEHSSASVSAPMSARAIPGMHPTPIISTDVNPQNQQYYEFQWRVLNLCAEFYGAAEELVVCAFRPVVLFWRSN